MPEDYEEEGGDMTAGGGGEGGILPDTDPNIGCEFINGQWVCPTPQQPTNTQQPTIKKKPISGTRGNLFWDSKEIIKKALQPLNKKKKQ